MVYIILHYVKLFKKRIFKRIEITILNIGYCIMCGRALTSRARWRESCHALYDTRHAEYTRHINAVNFSANIITPKTRKKKAGTIKRVISECSAWFWWKFKYSFKRIVKSEVKGRIWGCGVLSNIWLLRNNWNWRKVKSRAHVPYRYNSY